MSIKYRRKHLMPLRISSVPRFNLGTKEMNSRWKSATEFTKSTIGEALGKLYLIPQILRCIVESTCQCYYQTNTLVIGRSVGGSGLDETIGYREEFLREYGKIWCRGWTLSFSMVREALKFENELETKEMSFTRRSANEPKSDFHNLS